MAARCRAKRGGSSAPPCATIAHGGRSARDSVRAIARAMVVAAAHCGGRQPAAFHFFLFLKNSKSDAIWHNNVLKDPSLGSDTTVGDNGGSGSRFPGAQRKLKFLSRDTFNTLKLINKPFIGRLSIVTFLASRRLAPTSFTGKPALQKVGGDRSSNQATVDRQSGPRPKSRHLRQPALEGLTNSARMETPQRGGRNKSGEEAAARGWPTGGAWVGREERDTASRGPQPLWLRNHNFGLAQRIMVKSLTTSPHDPLGITDSACKNQLVVVSVQYGPFNTYIPIRSTTIGKSRVAKDPITMHASWRSNSDIASVTRQTHLPKTHPVLWPEIYHTIVSSDNIGYPRMKASGESSTTKHRLLHESGPHPIPPPNDPKTIQYNQDLGLFHSTNGNHLESPNEGSSIDHQVTIHLHAQNITMFPTNETWMRGRAAIPHSHLPAGFPGYSAGRSFDPAGGARWRANLYNQDLGLIHSTYGNHLESPNEGSSIDHQVTIHLHAQNITMFPTNETWYFTSQMLVSSSGGLILIFDGPID
ncbi:hypothetical protein F511_28595 [Dorcoceras hygrometricum]|uniref:Uncharacterized protein n=1 Tax=Dorcoceras hygrometricum TaxID=472368 RepID=A0A2Z7ADC8_9LAMI|nr:hypothetical protein F511_28595 [Dorcoceras hygrometricum]